MRRLAGGIAWLLLAALAVRAAPTARKSSPRPSSPPIDFSGVWVLDPGTSFNVSSSMSGAVLSVTQKGDHIWILPITKAGRPTTILGEEVVADGRSYEKALGPAGKGTVTANWAPDGQSLQLEVKAGEESDPNQSAIQRSVWKLSTDRNVWVRDSISVSKGAPRTSRLVFRRKTAEDVTPAPPPRRTPNTKR
jgi:hypothetical protein